MSLSISMFLVRWSGFQMHVTSPGPGRRETRKGHYYGSDRDAPDHASVELEVNK
jgi:hypothetical protein